jgi:hypothetical protein
MRLAIAVLVLAAVPGVALASPLMHPVPGEAFFGDVSAVAPPGAVTATFASRGVVTMPVAATPVTAGAVTGRLGIRSVTVVFRNGNGSVLARRSTSGAFLLPTSGRQAKPGAHRSIALERALARIAGRHGGVTGLWVQRLWDGRAAGWNANAEFPAASTVKLPLGVGAIMRMGPTPWRHPSWPDLSAALRASDNTAANNLVRRLGSGCGTSADVAAADGLRRLGARQSTFTDCYQGDELQPHLPAGSVARAPQWSNRHTTARDLGRMLYSLHAAAVPTPAARRQTGIPPMKARLILGLLLTAVQNGPNAKLFAGGLPAGTPIAEKNGWRPHEQHGAAIAYTRRGPVILVVLTQRPEGANLADARAIGAEVARAALRTA